MTVDELRQAIKDDDPKQFVREKLFAGQSWLFDQESYVAPGATYGDFRNGVYGLFDINPNSIALVGSSRFGYSLAPNKNFRAFNPAKGGSDLDCAVYNDTYDERKQDRTVITDRLRKISEIFEESKSVSDLFSKPVHLYTLFTSMDVLGPGRSVDWYTKVLQKFAEGYQSESNDKLFADYRRGAEQRTRSKGSRDLRGDSLVAFARTLAN